MPFKLRKNTKSKWTPVSHHRGILHHYGIMYFLPDFSTASPQQKSTSASSSCFYCDKGQGNTASKYPKPTNINITHTY